MADVLLMESSPSPGALPPMRTVSLPLETFVGAGIRYTPRIQKGYLCRLILHVLGRYDSHASGLDT
jgi:hypothetical protein